MRRKPLGQVVRKTRTLTDGTMTVRLLGCYYLSDEDSRTLIEVMVQGPWHLLLKFKEFRLYTLPDWCDPPTPIRPQFFFDPLGEQLVGSYLHPQQPEATPRTPAGYRRRVTYRFASFVPVEYGGSLVTPLGVLNELEWEPIPERLLRLIWLDE